MVSWRPVGGAWLVSIITAMPLLAGEPLDAKLGHGDDKTGIVWYDIRHLGLEGQGWTATKAPFDRLPAKAESMVRKPVWDLSHHSAGLCVRFETDSPSIEARWTLTSTNLAMPHMAATGVSGLDLYVMTKAGWHWLAVGQPKNAPDNSVRLVGGLPAGRRTYLLYLPLYNGVTSVELGLPAGQQLRKAEPYPAGHDKPVLFYGTSITQGGCASRPGMVHTAIIGRWLRRPVINLGFSGNGRMEPELASLLAELDPAVYVLDCLPNMSAKDVTERVEPFVLTLRKARPHTPIVLVEDRTLANAFLVPSKHKTNAMHREALRSAYERLVSRGVKGLSYLPGESLLGDDGEGTVDSSHPTDLGFMRQAQAFNAALAPLLDHAN
jgi:hypothetical protein